MTMKTATTTDKSLAIAAAARAASAKTRARLLEGGARVIAEHGFRAATMESIGAASGFSHQTVRDHFRTPTLLLTEIVSKGWRDITDAMPKDGEPIEQIMAAYDALAEFVLTKPNVVRCMLVDVLTAGPTGARLDNAEFNAFQAAIETAVRRDVKGRPGITAAFADIIISSMTHLVYARGVLLPNEARDVLTKVVTSALLTRWASGRALPDA
jgi:AcrR family transcriptional regulator